MNISKISTMRTGAKPNCRQCHSGKLLSFNWKTTGTGIPKEKSIFWNPEELKIGTLFQCQACDEYWYLDADEQFMNHVSGDRIELVRQWSEAELYLTAEQNQLLSDIGATPPDLYGNGSEYIETPCQVETTSGKVYPFAIISMQRHAPFENWRHYRLKSEISIIKQSPYTLPLEVRRASAQAEEISMGFAPTVVKLSNGQTLILNWRTHFIDVEEVDAARTTVCEIKARGKSPELNKPVKGIVYFVVDLIN